MSALPEFFLLFLALPILSLALAPGQIKNLVTFGDSYTDVVSVSDGGTPWPIYTAQYANLTLYPYARSGATCSNNITYRPAPSVFESQLPLYFAEKDNGSIVLDPSVTLYTQWIGTNDVGRYSIITGSNDASIVDVVRCMVDWVKVLYQNGARNFLVQNVCDLLSIQIPCTHLPSVDDPAEFHDPICTRIISQQVLHQPTEHYRMERVHA